MSKVHKMKYRYLSIREPPGLSRLVAGWARTHFEALIILEYSKVTFFWYAGDFDRRSVRLQDFSQLSFSLPTAHVAFSCCEFHPLSFCNKLRQIHTSCDTFPSNLAVRKESRRIYALDTCSAELSTGLDSKPEYVFLKSHKLQGKNLNLVCPGPDAFWRL